MSEGFVCDRCGDTHAGSPHTTITIGEGIPRSRAGDYTLHEPGGVDTEKIHDVCNDCKDAFEEWWENE